MTSNSTIVLYAEKLGKSTQISFGMHAYDTDAIIIY